MERKKAITVYIISLIVLTLLAGVGGGWLLVTFLPAYYFSWYPLVPVYFFLFSLLILAIYDYLKIHGKKDKAVLFYMGSRMMKLLVSMVLALVYAFVVKIQVQDFLVTFGIYYIVYMVFELCFFFLLERNKGTETEK